MTNQRQERAGVVAVAAVVAWAAGLAAQATPPDAPAMRELRTPDGSRFVLLPTGDVPVVHWVVATPAGVLLDPPGLEGLTLALVRAGMSGTSAEDSHDLSAERKALATLDQLEQAYDLARGRGMELPAAAMQPLEAARKQAEALHDPLRWERALRQVPALGPRLHSVAEGTLMLLTTTPRGIPRAAELLLQQREGGAVRNLHATFRAVRDELSLRHGGAGRDAMRREVLGLCYLSHPLSRAYAVPQGPAPVSLGQAMQTWAAIRHPQRGCHVLVGGFDPDQVEATLRSLFRTTLLPEVPLPATAPPPASAAERRASLPPGPTEALAIGYRLPPGTSRDQAAVLTEWLAGHDQARLPAALRELGRADARVTATAPFPGHAGDLLLVEIEATEPRPRAPLLADFDQAIAQVLQVAPKHDEVQDALARVRAHTAPARLGQANLALQLAIECGLQGSPASAALRPPADARPAQLATLARRVLAGGGRAVVTRGAAR